MSFEILSHTADEKFRAKGDTLNEVFSETVKAVGKIAGSHPSAGQYRHEINIESENLESLLFDFLDELIFLQDTEGVVVCHADKLKIDENSEHYELSTVIWVDLIEEDNYQDIKAPTYNEMKVNYEEEKGWIIEAVLDI